MKASVKPGLGRGLDAILGDLGVQESTASLEIAIGEIYPNPAQPRKVFDKQKIEELANSIKQSGLLSPLIVRKINTRYEIVAGERRYQASMLAGLKKIPCIVKDVSDEVAFGISLVENLQREDLNSMEEAEAYYVLSSQFHLSHQDIALRVSKDRSTITNSLRMLSLPEEVKASIRNGEISAGHARAILMAEKPRDQILLLHKILSKGLSVRETEAAVLRLRKNSPSKKKDKKDSFTGQLSMLLSERLSAHVVCSFGKKKGKIIINVSSKTDMERIAEKLIRDELPI
jgi:ParB family chromosome partitioning protein